MASIKDTAATSALNEEDYINELYDTNGKKRNELLKENFDSANSLLDNAQQSTGAATDAYTERTAVEADAARELYGDSGLTAGAQAQVLLNQENTRRRNINTLRENQQAADEEFLRQRQLLASRYEADIRQAQAENDMERAQALYQAAKQEEAQLLELQKQGAQLQLQRGSTAGYDAIAAGQTLPRDTGGETWEQVLANEDALHQIFDARLEGQRAQLEKQHAQAASDLEAQRQARERQTDDALTQAYVEGMKNRKDMQEVNAASGAASGTAAQQLLAEDLRLQDTLTEIRKNQLAADTQAGLQGFQLEADRGRDATQLQADNDAARAEALLEAAEAEEQTLVENQEFIGKQAAGRGDYSILAKLYGLPEEAAWPQYSSPPKDPGGEETNETEVPLEYLYGHNAPAADALGVGGKPNGWVITPGKTPVNQEWLADAVESGEVLIAQTPDGPQYVYNPNRTLR